MVAFTTFHFRILVEMKISSIIKFAYSLLLLLSTLSSDGSTVDHGHRGHEIGRSSMIDAGGVIFTAFSILEDAAMPEAQATAGSSTHMVRSVSDIFAGLAA